MWWLTILFLLFIPSQSAVASVSISEVAWMGSSESANHEWIELYNSGDEVSVADWTLSDGKNLNITLLGIIPANSYVVLERNRSDGASVVTPAPFLSYSGALVNTGATLTLTRADGSVADQVAGGENWQTIGGDNTTKDTAQYTSGGWITAPPTPGRTNATVASLPPTSSPPASPITQTTSSVKRSSVGVNTPTKSATPPPPAPLSLQLTLPQYIYEGQPVSLVVTPSGAGQTIRNSLTYEWNFGDLHTSTSKAPTHTYNYPGTYNVVVQATFAGQTATARQTVTVLPLTVSLAHTATGDVLLHNDALYEVDVSEYYLTSTKTKKIPPRTYLAPRETITVPWQMVADQPFPQTALFGRAKEIITRTAREASAPVAVATPRSASASDGVDQVVESVPSLISVVPAVSSEQVVDGGEVVESSVTPTLFGFATAQAPAPGLHTEVTSDFPGTVESMLDTEVDASAPIILGERAQSSGTPPTAGALSAVWAYLIFLLVLGGAVASIFLRPATKGEKVQTVK